MCGCMRHCDGKRDHGAEESYCCDCKDAAMADVTALEGGELDRLRALLSPENLERVAGRINGGDACDCCECSCWSTSTILSILTEELNPKEG